MPVFTTDPSPHLDALSGQTQEEQWRHAELQFNATVPLEWIDGCVNPQNPQVHRSCMHLRERQRSLPKRLLSVGSLDLWPCIPNLVETSTFDAEQVRYIALSHVWGSLSSKQREAISTTPDTLEVRQRGTELASFPPRYRASIMLCRCLGFRYMWIDSMCIVQGAGGDWEEESPRMASIYGSAALTLAINTRQNLFDSFFTYTEPYQQEAPTEWVALYETLADGVESTSWFVPCHNFRRSLYMGGVLGDRAWCLQERQLSSRMIHLLDNGIMLWECPSLSSSTALPHHFPFADSRAAAALCQDQSDRNGGRLAMLQRYTDREFYKRDSSGRHDLDKHDLDNHLYFWHLMLRDMGTRKLTFSSDNLAAMAGIATQFNYNTGLTYLSGVWKEDMPRGLLWTRTPERNTSRTMWKRFGHYQGPSWSWCSIDGPTQLIGFDETSQMSINVEPRRNQNTSWVSVIYDVEIHRANGNTHGDKLEPLREGSYLSMRGHLGRFECFNEVVWPSHLAQRDRFSPGREVGKQANLFNISPERRADMDLRIKGDAVLDIPGKYAERTLWCLLLAQSPEELSRSAVAMVLEPTIFDHASAVEATRPVHGFRRVGLAYLQTQNPEALSSVWTKCFGDSKQVNIF